jgi:hypothetical protein
MTTTTTGPSTSQLSFNSSDRRGNQSGEKKQGSQTGIPYAMLVAPDNPNFMSVKPLVHVK